MTQRTNLHRAFEAMQLCEKMEEMTGVDDLRSQVADSICHLKHLCRLVADEEGQPIDFADCMRSAEINFEAECEEDPDGLEEFESLMRPGAILNKGV